MTYFGLQTENMYGHKKRFEFILSAIKRYYTENQGKQIKILDIGCGTGEMITLPIAEAGYEIIGIDFDKNSINKAREKNIFQKANFYCESIQNFSYNSKEKYDVIICSEVLEHLKNPNQALLTMRKLMKNDGIIIITIPNGFGPFEIEKIIFYKTGLIKLAINAIDLIPVIFRIMQKSDRKKELFINMTENVECDHVQFFTMRNFQLMISSCGLKIENKSKSCFLAGCVTGFIFGRIHKIIDWNVNRIVNILPHYLCSGWYFIIKLDKKT